MTTNPTSFVDLNAAFSNALLDRFFEPIPTGRGPNGESYYAPSGVALMAQSLYQTHGAKILEEVWDRIDMDDFAGKVAERIVAELLKTPDRWTMRNTHMDKLNERVLEIVAQQLGQRVVDQMDLHVGPKEIETGETV